MSEYKYDAFISYRHLNPDSFVAGQLHRMLETYVLPKKLQKQLGKKRIKRVFRDKEELPITDSLDNQIVGNLAQSEFLIVICSPRLEESIWCQREIETFVSMRGKDNVLLVLADGEPATAFPKLIYDGTVEPLAADARGKNNHERIKNLKVEKLRILAQMLGVGFDDLKQRHRERKLKRIITAVACAAVIVFSFAALATFSAVKISHQADALAYDKALQLADESTKLLGDDKRLEAMKIAYEALTSSDGVAMPYTAEAQYALVDALRVYDSTKYSKAVLEIDADDTVCAIDFNDNPFEVLFADKSGNVAVWNYQEYDKVFECEDGIADSKSENIVGFIDKDNFFYINKVGEVVLSDVSGNIDFTFSDAKFKSAFLNQDKTQLAAVADEAVFVYDIASQKMIFSETISDCISTSENEIAAVLSDSLMFSDIACWNDAGTSLLYSVCSKTAACKEELRVVDLNAKAVTFSAQFANSMLQKGVFKDGVFYVLSMRQDGDLFRSYVCAIDTISGTAKWNSLFNGTSDAIYLTANDKLAVAAGNDMYLFLCDDGSLFANYSFGADIGCFTEKDNTLYVRNLNGDSSVVDTAAGGYKYLGKLIECTDLKQIKPLEITSYNYAYMGVAANGNDNHLIFYNYMENEMAKAYDGKILSAKYSSYFGPDARKYAEQFATKEKNTVYSVVSDDTDYAVVSYKNGKAAVYDLKSGTILYSRKTGTIIDKYFGQDIYGNKYFGNEDAAIMISPTGEIIANIENMAGLSANKKNILMNTYDEARQPVLLAYEIYDKSSLLEMAEFKMDYYNLF